MKKLSKLVVTLSIALGALVTNVQAGNIQMNKEITRHIEHNVGIVTASNFVTFLDSQGMEGYYLDNMGALEIGDIVYLTNETTFMILGNVKEAIRSNIGYVINSDYVKFLDGSGYYLEDSNLKENSIVWLKDEKQGRFLVIDKF